MANNQRLRRLGEKSMEPQNGKMMGWDVTVQRVRGGGRPVPKQVVGHAACRRYCLSVYIGASIGSEYIYHDEKCYRIINYGQTLQDVIE